MLSYIIQGANPMLESYSSAMYYQDIWGATSYNDVAQSGKTDGKLMTRVVSNSASITYISSTSSGVAPNTFATSTTSSTSYTVGANGYQTTSVLFQGRRSMSTYTGSRDVYDRVGTTTVITLSTGAYTGTNSTVLTQATTSTEQRSDHTFTYEQVPHNAPTSIQFTSRFDVVANTATVVPTGRNFAFANFNSVVREAVQVLTNLSKGVSTTDWRAWCSKVTTDATFQDTYYFTSNMPTFTGSFSYTRINITTAPWIYQQRVEKTITRSREFSYDFEMYSTTSDSLGNIKYEWWRPYPNSSTQTEASGLGGNYLYYAGLISEITSTQYVRFLETITEENTSPLTVRPVYRTATKWYTKSTRDLFGQFIDAGIGTTTELIPIGGGCRFVTGSNSSTTLVLFSENAQVKFSPQFITMGYGYTEWARSFDGYAPAGAGTRSSEYGELTSHAGVLDVWPFEQWDTYWYSEQESYYSLSGVAMVAQGVLALPPWCGVSSMIDGVGSVSALVDGENISYTTASSTESSSGTVTFVSIESSSFTYKIEKMGAPVTYYQGNEGFLNPNDLGLGDYMDFNATGDIVETSRFYELTGTEILKNYFRLNESVFFAGGELRSFITGVTDYSNNPWYLFPRVVQAPAKHMIYPETIALWGCFDTATGSTPATTIYSEYTTFLKSAYSRFRPIVLASLA